MKCQLWSVLVTGPAWPLSSAVSVEDKAPGAWRGLERADLALGQQGPDKGTGRHIPGFGERLRPGRAVSGSIRWWEPGRSQTPFPLDRWVH